MSVSREAEAFAIDLFAGLGPIRIKRMFGAALAYAGEFNFALLDDESTWIKVDESVEAAFFEAGSPRFTYVMKDGRQIEMDYRGLPETAMDDPDEALSWARLGVEAGMRAAAKKAAKPKKKAKA